MSLARTSDCLLVPITDIEVQRLNDWFQLQGSFLDSVKYWNKNIDKIEELSLSRLKLIMKGFKTSPPYSCLTKCTKEQLCDILIQRIKVSLYGGERLISDIEETTSRRYVVIKESLVVGIFVKEAVAIKVSEMYDDLFVKDTIPEDIMAKWKNLRKLLSPWIYEKFLEKIPHLE